MAILKLTNITKIAVQFSPYRPGAASARAFLASVMCDKVKATNPKCEIVTVVKTDDSEPLVDIVYADGEKHRMRTETLKIKEILAEIGYHNSRFPETDDLTL